MIVLHLTPQFSINLKMYVEYQEGLGLWCLMPLSTIFQLYRGSQFIGGGNMSAQRKSLTCR